MVGLFTIPNHEYIDIIPGARIGRNQKDISDCDMLYIFNATYILLALFVQSSFLTTDDLFPQNQNAEGYLVIGFFTLITYVVVRLRVTFYYVIDKELYNLALTRYYVVIETFTMNWFFVTLCILRTTNMHGVRDISRPVYDEGDPAARCFL